MNDQIAPLLQDPGRKYVTAEEQVEMFQTESTAGIHLGMIFYTYSYIVYIAICYRYFKLLLYAAILKP